MVDRGTELARSRVGPRLGMLRQKLLLAFAAAADNRRASVNRLE